MPNILDSLSIQGSVECFLIRNGKVIWYEKGQNLVVNTGRTKTLDQLFGGITASRPYTNQIIQYMALGSSSTAALATDTALGLEATGGSNVRKLVTITSPSLGIYQASALWLETDNENTTIGELGLFANSTGGGSDVMFSHYVFGSTISKDQYTQFAVNYNISLSSS